jgi:predicted secreted protein
LKLIGATVLVFSLLANGVFATTAIQKNTIKPIVPAQVNQTASKVLIANKTIDILNLVNTIKINEVIKTDIYENPSTGYSWNIEVLGDQDAISYTFEFVPVPVKIDAKTSKKIEQKPLICGEGTFKTLAIKGLKPGKATVKMTLLRPWEKNIAPVKTMEFEIEVK